MPEIPLTKGQIALVDDEDCNWLNQWKWCALPTNNGFMACRHGSEFLYMHRVILGAEKGQLVDHINHNQLDNRKQNLRICTQSQNLMNREKTKRSKSGYKGVFWHKIGRKWLAQIKVNHRTFYLGLFSDVAEAAKAYDRAAVQHCAEFAMLNFPVKG
jgi:hypothetical protein